MVLTDYESDDGKPKLQTVGNLRNFEIFQRSDDPVGLMQLLCRMCTKHCEYAAVRGYPRTHAGRRIFNDDALFRSKSEQRSASPVRLRIGLAPLYHVSANDPSGDRQLRCLQPTEQQPAGR